MSEQLTLRAAIEDDAPMLAWTIRNAFEEYRDILDPPTDAHLEGHLTVLERLKRGSGVVALFGAGIVGCAFYEVMGGKLYLERLAVHPSFRNQGIGRRLIEFVEREARDLGFDTLHLGVRIGPAGPEHAGAYYERFGYQYVGAGAHAGYAEPTYILMGKRLGLNECSETKLTPEGEAAVKKAVDNWAANQRQERDER